MTTIKYNHQLDSQIFNNVIEMQAKNTASDLVAAHQVPHPGRYWATYSIRNPACEDIRANSISRLWKKVNFTSFIKSSIPLLTMGLPFCLERVVGSVIEQTHRSYNHSQQHTLCPLRLTPHVKEGESLLRGSTTRYHDLSSARISAIRPQLARTNQTGVHKVLAASIHRA